MLREVIIIEQETGKVIVTDTILLGGQNYKVSDEKYFNDAWKNAVEDKLVVESSRDKYIFTFKE